MFAAIERIFPFAFAISWFGVSAILWFRFRAKQRAYLHRFPPVDGVPLDMYVGGGPRSVTRALFQAMWRRQPDPTLEQRRRDLWRRWRHVLAWVFGFPITVFVVVLVLSLTGQLH